MNLVRFLFITSLSLCLLSCTKKRDPSFPEGEGTDLLLVSDYDQRKEDVATQSAKADVSYQSASLDKDIGEGVAFKIVNFETKAPLFPAEINLAGIPNSHIKLIYKLTPTKLIIFKNAIEKELPTEELMLAEKENDGTFSVGIVSYSVTGFYKVDVAKDENGSLTSKLKDFQVQDKSQATHFRINKTPEVSSISDIKNAVFKSNYFDGEWYCSNIIFNKIGSSEFKLETPDKIEFVKTENDLVIVSKNESEKNSNKLDSQFSIFKIPIEYWDSAKPSHVNWQLKSDDSYRQSKSWKEREWVILDFKKSIKSDGSPIVSDSSLVQFNRTDDFFMFTLQNGEHKVILSFKRVLSNQIKKDKYFPKKLFNDDLKYFGFFGTIQNQNAQNLSRARISESKTVRWLNRFNFETYMAANGQSRKRILFRLSDVGQSSARYIEAIRQALKAWDEAFKIAGLVNVDLVLDESVKVKLGDIRYNIINTIKSESSLYENGYSKGIVDSGTGEIVSGSANVDLDLIASKLKDSLELLVLKNKNALDVHFPFQDSLLKGLGVKYVPSSIAPIENEKITERKDSDPDVENKKRKEKNNLYIYGKTNCQYEITVGHLENEISKLVECKDIKMADSVSIDEKNKIINKCIESLFPLYLKAALIHELGHTLGLRHNFAGSIGKENKSDQVMRFNASNSPVGQCIMRSKKIAVNDDSSSVMDFFDFDQPAINSVGLYDVEAIRFGYKDSIMDNSCKSHKLDTSKSIDQNINQKETNWSFYKFCTDEHFDFKMDPTCAKFDAGSTPLEIVRTSIRQYNMLFAVHNEGLGNQISLIPSELISVKKDLIFDRLEMIYEKWRMYLKLYLDSQNLDLSGLSHADYIQQLNKMQSHPNFSAYYEDYYQATREIYKFYDRILFLPDRNCKIMLADSHIDIVDLRSLSELAKSRSGSLINLNCFSSSIKNEIDHTFKAKLINQAGFFIENQTVTAGTDTQLQDVWNSEVSLNENLIVDKSEKVINRRLDFIGSILDKKLALSQLVERSSESLFMKQRGLSFSMLDEPDLRSVFIERLKNRTLWGISSSDLEPGTKDFVFFEKWQSETDFLISIWSTLRNYLDNLGKLGLNNDDVALLDRMISSSKASLSSIPEEQKLELSDGRFLVARNASAKLTLELISRVKFLKNFKINQPEKFKVNQKEYEAQAKLLQKALSVDP